jgi:hypothetical protein
MPTKIFLIIIILTILSLKHVHAEYKRDHHNHLNPENHINPKPGEQPLVANGNFLDSTQFIQSKNKNHGRRLILLVVYQVHNKQSYEQLIKMVTGRVHKILAPF